MADVSHDRAAPQPSSSSAPSSDMPPAMSPPAVMPTAVKRACDACHRRKVKCDGVNPCRNCHGASLSCTYNAIPQKKGPKGSRAKIISELRENQRQTSLAAKVHNRINGAVNTAPDPSCAPTVGMLTSELVKECLTFFFDNMNAQAPILERAAVEQQVLYMEQNRDAYCMMASMCAFVLLQPGASMPPGPGESYNLDQVPGANIVASQLLAEEALRVRKGYDYLDQITVNALATNFFLFGCFFAQEMHEKAWFHLREATTMIQMAGMNTDSYYQNFETAAAARLRRIYWLFFVIERAYAIQRQRPLTLQATISLPTHEDDPHDPLAHQLSGFILLVNVFQPFDDAFTSAWNKTRGHLSPAYISTLQKDHNELVQGLICRNPSWDDVATNQEWLKRTVWTLTDRSMGNAAEQALGFQQPVNMFNREILMNMASHFPGQGMELLRLGLIEKLLECASSMIEYLGMQAPSRDPFAVGPQQYLGQIIAIVAAARNDDFRFLPLLMSKVSEILPRLANPMLRDAPEAITMANMDIFDGFGNAGMAQPPQMPLMDTEFDRKYTVEEYDNMSAMDMSAALDSHGNPNSGPSRQPSEMASSFVSSPPMMSPTLEYPHNTTGYAFTPMPGMVMSPMMNPHQHMGQPSSGHCPDPMGQPHMNMVTSPSMASAQHMGPGQNMRPAMQSNLHMPNTVNMVNVQQPAQRQGSFAMPGPLGQPQQQQQQQGGFAMPGPLGQPQQQQRQGSFAMPGPSGQQQQHFHNMNAMTGELNFNTLR